MVKKKVEQDVRDDLRCHDTWRLLKKYRDVVWSLELKSILDAAAAYLMESDTSLLCDTYHTTELGKRDLSADIHSWISTAIPNRTADLVRLHMIGCFAYIRMSVSSNRRWFITFKRAFFRLEP